jgi:hypothetical protein
MILTGGSIFAGLTESFLISGVLSIGAATGGLTGLTGLGLGGAAGLGVTGGLGLFSTGSLLDLDTGSKQGLLEPGMFFGVEEVLFKATGREDPMPNKELKTAFMPTLPLSI